MVFAMGRRSPVKELFQRAVLPLWAAIADIRRLVKLWAEILLIAVTMVPAVTTRPAASFAKGTAVADMAEVTAAGEGKRTVVKAPAERARLIWAPMFTDFSGDRGTVFSEDGSYFFEAGKVIKFCFNGGSCREIQVFLFLHHKFLLTIVEVRKSQRTRTIIHQSSEKLNAMGRNKYFRKR